MEITVADASSRSRYEIAVDGVPAGFAAYADAGPVRVFIHTEIDPAYEGRGLGGRLIGGALDDVRHQGRQLVARCPFVRAYLDRHGDYADLVAGQTSA